MPAGARKLLALGAEDRNPILRFCHSPHRNAADATGTTARTLPDFANPSHSSFETSPMRAFLLLIVVFAAATFSTEAASGQGTDRSTKVANDLVELINAADYAGIQTKFNKEMDAALPLEKSREFFRRLAQQLGNIQKLGEPQPVGGAMVFPTKFEKGTLDMQIVVDGQGLIAGLLFKPHVPTKPAPEKHETQLSLPFKGSWLVFWGGDTRELNHHHDEPNQRFALDLLGVGEDGKTQQGDGTRNEDFYAFGRELSAPAEGTVIEVIDGVRDNNPGSMNPYSALGNCVVIQHREGEVSVLAHLKQGSIVVKVNDNVKRGQLLGKCGNSGNSSEPHLHYHLQNAAVLQDGLGIKCVFQKVVVTRNGKAETPTSFSPEKGQIISPH